MPMIYFSKEIPIIKFRKYFKKETGLDLKVYIGETEITNEIKSIDKFLLQRRRKNRINRFFNDYRDFYIFPFDNDISELVNEFKELLGIRIKIFKEKKEIDYSLTFEDIIPEKFKSIKINEDKFIKLNSILSNLSKEIFKKGNEANEFIKLNRKKDKWVKDSEIEVKIQYFLDSKDPMYLKDFDNIFFEQTCRFDVLPEMDELDWTIVSNYELKEKVENQCWLFHDLTDHYGIELTDLQRIGKVWTDIEVILQNVINL